MQHLMVRPLQRYLLLSRVFELDLVTEFETDVQSLEIAYDDATR